MVAQNSKSIQAAIRDCLARCYRGTTPLGEIAQFVSELRAQGWDEADIQKVQASVQRILSGVMSPDDPDAKAD